MPTPIYRAGKLGVELSESLNDMVEAQAVPGEMHEQVMQSFDKHLNEFLKDNWSKARIKDKQLQGRIENGVIRSYRNVNNTWEFELEQATFRGQAFDAAVRTSKDQGKLVKNIHVVIIDQKVAEAARPDSPARVKASAGAADADSAPAMTADSWEDWEDDQPPQQPSQPAGHVSVEQAQAQRQARAEEQAQAAAREQYAAANETSLALARGAGPSSQPPAAAADEDEDLDDWEAVENDDNPLDDKPANKKQKRGSEDAQDDFDFGDDLNSDDDGARPHRARIAPIAPASNPARHARTALSSSSSAHQPRAHAPCLADDEDIRMATEPVGIKHEEGKPPPNTVFAQFKKVKRQASKQKWNCELLAGTATIDGFDYAFTKCDAVFAYR